MLVICASNLMVTDLYTAWKVSKYGVISVSNAEKYGPEKTLYLDPFHAMLVLAAISTWKF